MTLTDPMRELLWTVAQHKYGWSYCPNRGRLQTAEALERRGLVTVDRSHHDRYCSATDAGRAVIERLWPVSPFILGTYDHQPELFDALREAIGDLYGCSDVAFKIGAKVAFDEARALVTKIERATRDDGDDAVREGE